MVVALTEANNLVVARQFRAGPDLVMDELPGGYVDEGESPEEAAVRELREETGYVAARIEYLGYVYKDSVMNGKWHIFLAVDCRRVAEQKLDGPDE